MRKVAHVSDPHFNFLIHDRNHDLSPHATTDETIFKDFCRAIHDSNCEAIIITGDITEAPFVEADLKYFQNHLKLPIYFILGNHDFYQGTFKSVEKTAENLTLTSKSIKWLGACDFLHFTEKSCLIGDDGWYDIKAGYAEHSRLLMTDFNLIHDFRFQHHLYVVAESRKRAACSAARIEALAEQAVKKYETIYIATHVPPFTQASLSPKREPSDGNWAAYMVNVVLGDTLIGLAEENRDKKFIVLAGHTHTNCTYKAWHNLEVRVGSADYGSLMFDVVEIE